MVLRNPISGTKRFLQRTLQSVKSMFSITISTGGGGGGGYHKLPKYDMNSLTEATRIGFHHSFSEEIAGSSAAAAVDGIKQLKAAKTEGKGGSATHEGKRWWVAEKLREMLDPGDLDHSVDIDEVLHYYSRLTCPAYLDIVDRFLMEMYLEFISPPEIEMAVVGGGDSGWRLQPRRISL